MRILALIALIAAFVCVFGVTATALGREDAKSAPTPAPEFAENVPPLLPMTTAEPARVSSGGIDEPVLIAAVYWLLIGGVALRRARRAGSYSVSTAA